MPRILFGVSPIGLGHATRALVLSEELRRGGAEVRMFSGGRAASFVKDAGVEVESIVEDPVPRMEKGEMSRVSLWYLRSWLANRRTLPRTRRLFDEFQPDLVVCDEEFSGIIVAKERGIRRVFVSDELDLGFARTWLARRIEGRVLRWYRGLQQSVDLLVVPEDGPDGGNRINVGPIVRRATSSCADVRAKHGLPAGRMVLFAMSGTGVGRELVEKLAGLVESPWMADAFLVVAGNVGRSVAGERVYDLGVVVDNQDLVACADLVVSTAGKSTIDEAAAAGTPIIAVPVKHHAEQERNAAALGYSSGAADRLGELVREKIGRREPPRRFDGERAAAKAILALCPGARS